MRFSLVFCSLVARGLAVDIWLNWHADNCRGANSLHCPQMNPNTCCGLDGATFASIDFREIPTDWSLELRGHQGPKCGPAIQFASVYRRSNICINKGPFGGGGYGFFEKRSDTSQDCHETVTPSTLAFVDGPQYNLTDLDASSLHELVRLYLTYEDEICADYCYSHINIASSGGNSTDVPHKFKRSLIAEEYMI